VVEEKMASLNQIEHIVVVMLENRSFDNIAGWLYDPANLAPFNKMPPANFEGLYGKALGNPGPNGHIFPVSKGYEPSDPQPDPGEPYQDVYAQLYGQQQVLALNLVPPDPPTSCNMEGFIYDYAAWRNKTNPEIIMNAFTPTTLPVFSSLAYNYSICDHWFCSVPTQTICNRSFVHAGTSSGYVNNEGDNGLLFVNKTQTIFNLLSSAGRKWKIYCGGWMVTSLVFLTQEKVWDYAMKPDYFTSLHDFEADAQKPGGLPSYSFIEPNYMDSLVWGPQNDMHPESHKTQLYGPSNVEQGERLLYRIYTAVRNSPDWDKTLLLILFDEHGGTYDHVVPPETISPDDIVIPPTQPGGSGFKFNRLGVRVPAVIVSPFTPPGTVLNTVFDHTSVLSTVAHCFGLPLDQLGKRATAAANVSGALSLDSARTDRPSVPQPLVPEVTWAQRAGAMHQSLLQADAKNLSLLHQQMLTMASQRLGRTDLIAEAQKATTALEADSVLVKLEAELVRRRLTSS
jgi:phospholipase C